MKSMKGKTRGEELYNQVSAVIEKMQLPWSKLANITTMDRQIELGMRLGC